MQVREAMILGFEIPEPHKLGARIVPDSLGSGRHFW